MSKGIIANPAIMYPATTHHSENGESSTSGTVVKSALNTIALVPGRFSRIRPTTIVPMRPLRLNTAMTRP
ncbi:hypothetical protein OG535_00750 [Kitasatospora sp. NBC_00085]|uniref:hypothetical protein n=1 Tax=unclassified Kitasatospora TaxID=2633591 RepID=UPI002F909BDF